VNEDNLGFGAAPSGFEMRRYDYRLTDDGKRVAKSFERDPEFQSIKSACESIVAAGDPDYFTLSIAAKAFFILNKRAGKGMSRDEIIREAKKFDWDITADSLEKAVSFLEQISLVRRKNNDEN
jgi:hypothetical protein